MFQHRVKDKCRSKPQKIVLPEGLEPRILRAAEQLYSAGLARPILLGVPHEIESQAVRLGVNLEGLQLVDWKVHMRRKRSFLLWCAVLAGVARGTWHGSSTCGSSTWHVARR